MNHAQGHTKSLLQAGRPRLPCARTFGPPMCSFAHRCRSCRRVRPRASAAWAVEIRRLSSRVSTYRRWPSSGVSLNYPPPSCAMKSHTTAPWSGCRLTTPASSWRQNTSHRRVRLMTPRRRQSSASSSRSRGFRRPTMIPAPERCRPLHRSPAPPLPIPTGVTLYSRQHMARSYDNSGG